MIFLGVELKYFFSFMIFLCICHFSFAFLMIFFSFLMIFIFICFPQDFFFFSHRFVFFVLLIHFRHGDHIAIVPSAPAPSFAYGMKNLGNLRLLAGDDCHRCCWCSWQLTIVIDVGGVVADEDCHWCCWCRSVLDIHVCCTFMLPQGPIFFF